ncbi:dipeptidyl carboxypeptidase Dcp [Klebsiella pneumoniae subsp. ozaenae]|uniref:Dipeptidyl carboxypeptidase Dcp n=1 Tax=Klebsiella pneumoniae subsp. ozaenae TaxID=574 RepID=A0A378B3R5_KLEPO|nr:dipeptidyl carboxypeptidase Dcp [Klebsiella pneumoniae subsp. ozaenae]
MRVWEIFDHNGEGDGRCFTVTTTLVTQRAAAHGWMCLSNSRLCARSAPVIYNVCNYVRPQAGQSALLSWDELITLFHEFGHTLHGPVRQPALRQSLGDQYAARFCRISFADLRTLASQPQVFAPLRESTNQSGEPMPQALRDNMLRAATFNKGYDMSELLAAALLDMRVAIACRPRHYRRRWTRLSSWCFGKRTWIWRRSPPRYRSSYFSHIFGGGYAAGYYAYLWTQMLADDGYQWFVEPGRFDPVRTVSVSVRRFYHAGTALI